MKKIFYFLIALLIAGVIGRFVFEVCQTTAYVQTQGREGTVMIEQLYSASHWAEPLPLKKIYAYTAILAPNYPVVIESDQELVAGQEYFIRFLSRDKAAGIPPTRFRPIPGSIRMRAADDGTPTQVTGSTLLERMVTKAKVIDPRVLGIDPAKAEVPAIPAVPAAAAPAPHTGSVPFVLGGANDTLFELIWNNSQTGEWAAVIFAGMLFMATVLHACAHPWRTRPRRSESKDFVHPAMFEVEPSPLPAEPRPRVPFKPGAAQSDPEPIAEAKATPPADPVLKLPRK